MSKQHENELDHLADVFKAEAKSMKENYYKLMVKIYCIVKKDVA